RGENATERDAAKTIATHDRDLPAEPRARLILELLCAHELPRRSQPARPCRVFRDDALELRGREIARRFIVVEQQEVLLRRIRRYRDNGRLRMNRTPPRGGI